MKGIRHSVWVTEGPHKGKFCVVMCNNDNSHYVQIFQEPEELLEFVAELHLKGKEAWGHKWPYMLKTIDFEREE